MILCGCKYDVKLLQGIERNWTLHVLGESCVSDRILCGCVQYDVELVQHIESLIGHELAEFTLDEAQVLKGISRVYAAKRVVAVKALEDESRDDKHRQLINRRSKKPKQIKHAQALEPPVPV